MLQRRRARVQDGVARKKAALDLSRDQRRDQLVSAPRFLLSSSIKLASSDVDVPILLSQDMHSSWRTFGVMWESLFIRRCKRIRFSGKENSITPNRSSSRSENQTIVSTFNRCMQPQALTFQSAHNWCSSWISTLSKAPVWWSITIWQIIFIASTL